MATGGSARSQKTSPSTPDTADPRLARITTEPPKLVRVTREGWARLLGSLSAEELARYGQIAYDQYQRELRYRWAQMLMLLLATGGLIATARLFLLWGYSRTGVLALGLSALLSYWPYRGAKVRRLWRKHHRAVQKELERRRTRAD